MLLLCSHGADFTGDWLESCQYPVSVNQTRRVEDQLSAGVKAGYPLWCVFVSRSELRVQRRTVKRCARCCDERKWPNLGSGRLNRALIREVPSTPG
jgi:hypothetical protein